METLEPGKPYFIVGFYDKEFIYPVISTYVFLGVDVFEEKEPNEPTEYCFQDGASFGEHGNLNNSSPEASDAEFVILNREQLDMVVDKEGLVEWLQEVHSPYLKPEGF